MLRIRARLGLAPNQINHVRVSLGNEVPFVRMMESRFVALVNHQGRMLRILQNMVEGHNRLRDLIALRDQRLNTMGEMIVGNGVKLDLLLRGTLLSDEELGVETSSSEEDEPEQ